MNVLATPVPLSKPFFVSAPVFRGWSKIFRKSIQSVAENSELLAPAHTFQHPSAVFTEADLQRITASSTSTVGGEFAVIRGGPQKHKEVYAHLLRGVLLNDGILYGKGFRRAIGVSKGPLFKLSLAEFVPGGILSQCWLGSKYFGHSLHDEMPLGLLGQTRGPLVAIQRPISAQQKAYGDMFNINPTLLPESAWIDRLEILEDQPFSLSKVERWKVMRRTFAAHGNGGTHPGVFLKRGNTGQSRIMVNEDEIADHFAKLGFTVINPALSDFAAVVKAAAGAKVVAGIEGSHMVHGFLGLAEGGAMLMLQPPYRFDTTYKTPCDLLGLTYSFAVGYEAEGGFRLNPDQIGPALDRIEKRSQVLQG